MTKSQGVLAVLVTLWAGSAAWADTYDVEITQTVNYSQLDGGPLDGDQMANGEFYCRSLTVRSTGAIVVDVTNAVFYVEEDVHLQNSGAVRTPSMVTNEAGPGIGFVAAGSFYMSGTSLLRSHGRMYGGTIQVFAAGNIELKQSAKIEAHGTMQGTGGFISLVADGTIRLVNSTNRITANGFNGGSVYLTAFACDCPAIYINAVINAVGFNGEGGVVFISADNGGVAVVGEPGRIAAIGTSGYPGSVTIHADTTVTPEPIHTQPAALVTENGESCDNCHP